jgi:Tol biopolymer transport system component
MIVTLQPIKTIPPIQVITPKPIYKGFIAYDRAQETVQGYDFNGAPLNIKIKTTGANWIQGQWANNSIYYYKAADKSIVQLVNGGAAQKLSFIPAKDGLHFVISPDGKKIAWSFEVTSATNPASELWIANIDGAGAKKIAQIDSATNTKWMVVQPYRWLADGRLLYVDSPTGIGGYILFSGFGGIHLYDPASAKQTNLTPGVGAGSMCLKEIDPDLKTVLSACAVSGNQALSYINLANNQVSAIAVQPDQSQVGSPAYSPSGDWLAYAFAHADPENETGKVAVLKSGATDPKIVGSLIKGYFNVETWINENQFVAQRYEGELSSVWLFNRDGSAPVKLADGVFVSVIMP